MENGDCLDYWMGRISDYSKGVKFNNESLTLTEALPQFIEGMEAYMAKKAEQDKKTQTFRAGGREIEIFKTQDQLSLAYELPHGVLTMTTIQVKFETPGQSIHGQYLGSVSNKSTFDGKPDYMFHEVRLPNGMVIGFCGSSQLDRTLQKIDACKYDVHIIFAGYKNISGGKKFKIFHIFTKLLPLAKVPPDRPTYDEFGNLSGDDNMSHDNCSRDDYGFDVDPKTGEVL